MSKNEEIGEILEQMAFWAELKGENPFKVRALINSSEIVAELPSNISDLLAPDAVLAGLKVQSKKQLLQDLAARAHGLTRLSERRIFETLVERERLGTTGVGAGIDAASSRSC